MGNIGVAQEIEIKLRVVSGGVQAIQRTLRQIFNIEALDAANLRNVYFDTPDLQLNQQRVALRIRQQGEHFIQTLKTKGSAQDGLHRRGEWEWAVPAPVLDSDLLRQCASWPATLDTGLLEPVFETNFVRHSAQLSWRDFEIELAYDVGYVLYQDDKLEINEIELEYVSGEPSSLLALSEVLQAELSVEAYDVSKAERGYHLYQQTKGEAC